MPHVDATATRLPILWRVVLPAILGAIGLFISSQAPAGSVGFYVATFFTAAVWLGTWCLWGDRKCFRGRAPKELARGAAIGIGLIALFIAGALMVRLIPFLAAPVNDLLDNMRYSAVPITLATLIINGIGEELFFRDVARHELARIWSPTRQPFASLIAQVSLYIAVTAAMGIPLLLVASVLIGGIAALEARRAGNLISATTLHLVWSTGMAFLLPLFIN